MQYDAELVASMLRSPGFIRSNRTNTVHNGLGVSQTLDAICKRMQEDRERFTCGISGDIMVDPVIASNGYSHCRFSMFIAMDRNFSMPGDDDGEGFRIVGA